MCVERCRSAAVLLVSGLFVLSAATARAAEQVFEPGTKHVCVPAASGEGWDCNSGENPPTVPKAPREPRLRSSSEVPAESVAEPASTVPAAEPTSPGARSEPAVAPAQTGSTSQSARSVPNYLLAPDARESAAGAPTQPTSVAAETPRNAVAPAAAKPEPAAAARETPDSRVGESSAPAAAAEDPPRAAAPASASPAVVAAPPTVAAPMSTDSTARPAESAPARETPSAVPAAMPTTDATPSSAPASATASAPYAPAVAPATVPDSAAAESRPASTSHTLLGAAEFRRLADSRYVLELGSGRSRDAVERNATANAPAGGPIYVLALQRDGESWHLAVWGDFDSVDAARRARAELLANGATGVGWPRRAGPLKQELGR